MLNQKDAVIPQDVLKKVQFYMEETIQPKVLIGGKTGVGKSSLLNAILGQDVYETGVTPMTIANSEEIWNSAGGKITVIDVPGFGEANAKSNYEENIKLLARLEAHCFLLVIKCDDRALQLEEEFLTEIQKDPIIKGLPVIIAVNQIDKMKPVRDWEPSILKLNTPITEKEKNIRTYIDYVSRLSVFSKYALDSKIVPVCAGESFNDPLQYGIEDLQKKIYDILPDAAKAAFARTHELRKIEAERIVKKYAGTCFSAVAANFMPASDALILAPIQIAMIIHLGKLYKINVTVGMASGILSSLGLSFAGRWVASTLVSLIPAIKNFVGPPLALSLTYSMGMAVSEMFTRGKVKSTQKELEEFIKKHEKAAQKAAQEELAKEEAKIAAQEELAEEEAQKAAQEAAASSSE